MAVKGRPKKKTKYFTYRVSYDVTAQAEGTVYVTINDDDIDVVDGNNWVVLHKKGGYVWNEDSGKTMDITRNGRRFDMEIFVPDSETTQGTWEAPKNPCRPMKHIGNSGTPTSNRFSVFDKRDEDSWKLSFVGQA